MPAQPAKAGLQYFSGDAVSREWVYKHVKHVADGNLLSHSCLLVFATGCVVSVCTGLLHYAGIAAKAGLRYFSGDAISLR
jgi:hypothetical protein